MHTDRATGLALLGMCAVGWIFLIPNYIPGDAQQIFPKAILIFIALPSLGMCLRGHAPTKDREEPLVAASRRKAFFKTGVMAAAYFVYLLLIPVLGFYVCGLIATVGFLLFLGVRNPKVMFFVPLATFAAMHIVIERFLHFTLPSGILL